MRILLLVPAALCGLLSSLMTCSHANAQEAAEDAVQESRSYRIDHDDNTFVTTLTVLPNEGRVAWRDVLLGLAEIRGFKDDELATTLPSAGFVLHNPWTSLTFGSLDRLARPYIRFRIAGNALRVQLNRVVLLESQRRFKQRLRSVLTAKDLRQVKPKFGLQKYTDINERTKLLLVTVHGYNSFADRLDTLIVDLNGPEVAKARFGYRNDQPIEQSAQALSKALRRLVAKRPNVDIALITHSMGGIVARRVIEDPALDPGNVSKIVMIAPPNHGSELAHFAFAADLWQLLGDRRRNENLDFFFNSIEDGLGEAAIDLQPNSIFLTSLNRLGRNSNVEYSIILGKSAPIEKEDVTALQEKLRSLAGESRWARFFGSKLDRMISNLDALVDGNGDGVVSVVSGRLPGVSDVIVLPISHLAMVSESDSEASRSLRAEIAKRLGF